jgi:hypothetical protein
MSFISPELPTLIVNASFMREFISAQPPCCALGLVEVQNQIYAFIALRPEQEIPPHISDNGFAFGHTLIGNSISEVIHFCFDFYDYQAYNVLINPNNPIVQTVLKTMIDNGNYFFFCLDHTSGNVTAFRSDVSQDNLKNLTGHWHRIQSSTTTDEQYLQSVIYFLKNPDPIGELLQWVCCDSINYLDLSKDRLEMKPQ